MSAASSTNTENKPMDTGKDGMYGKYGMKAKYNTRNSKRKALEDVQILPQGMDQAVAKKRKTTETTQDINKSNKRQVKTTKKKRKVSEIDLSTMQSVLKEIESRPTDGAMDVDRNMDSYADDHITYLQTIEKRWIFSRNYLPGKGVITPNMRAILVDWLIQVQDHLQLNNSTLHMAIALLDKFLSTHALSVSKLQLVGTTCLFIATKYLEGYHPKIALLVYLADRSFSHRDVIEMERLILKIIDFDLSVPDPLHFLHHFLQDTPHSQKVEDLCQYLLDLCLCDVVCVEFPASTKAAAALCLSKKILEEDNNVWPPSLIHCNSYTESYLKKCMDRMANQLSRVRKVRFQAAREKFGNEKYRGISKMSLLKTSPHIIETHASFQ